MSETLSRRVGRLVSGGFHALIDAAENLAPEAVMNESIREIERAVDEVRAELGKVLAQKHLAAKKMADESNRHEAIDANLQAAVDAGRDDLAEAGIAEQMDIEARLPSWKTPLPIVPHRKKSSKALSPPYRRKNARCSSSCKTGVPHSKARVQAKQPVATAATSTALPVMPKKAAMPSTV